MLKGMPSWDIFDNFFSLTNKEFYFLQGFALMV